jgi:L-fuconolactonase
VALNVFDTHTHVISPQAWDFAGGPPADSPQRAVNYRQLLEAMDQAGIARAVIMQAAMGYGSDNRYVAEAIAAHPDRLQGIFSVDVLAQDAVAQMRRWRGAGLGGMRPVRSFEAVRLDDARAYPTWEYAQQHHFTVCLKLSTEALPALQGLLTQFPKLCVLLDHLGQPDLADGPPDARAAPLFNLAAHPGVYLQLTNRSIAAAAAGAFTPDAFLPRLLAAFGAGRIAWGSGFPNAEGSMASLLADAQNHLAILSAGERAWIFEKTAQMIYPFEATARAA